MDTGCLQVLETSAPSSGALGFEVVYKALSLQTLTVLSESWMRLSLSNKA